MPQNNRIRETTVTTGASQTLTLAGAPVGFRSFVAGIGAGNQCFALVAAADGTWEIRRGAVASGPPATLSFAALVDSSTGAPVNFAAGTKTVVCVTPAQRDVFVDTDDIARIPGGLNVDSNTLVVDAANNRVGIGAAAPVTALANTGSAASVAVAADGITWRVVSTDLAAHIRNDSATGHGLRVRSASTAGAQNVLVAENGAGVVFVATAAGEMFFHALGTTASAANAFLNSAAGNQLLRSTSSARFKRDIEPLDPAVAQAVWERFEPVWYRSAAEADNPAWSWYGALAEDLAALDPRLVHWTRLTLPDGAPDRDAAAALPPETPGWTDADGYRWVPDGAQYERLALVALAGARARIAALESRIAALEARP